MFLRVKIMKTVRKIQEKSEKTMMYLMIELVSSNDI